MRKLPLFIATALFALPAQPALAYGDEPSNSENLLLVPVVVIVAFIIGIFLTRAIFSIPRILRTMRAQAYLTALVAEKAGADPQEIRAMLAHIDDGDSKLNIREVTKTSAPSLPPMPISDDPAINSRRASALAALNIRYQQEGMGGEQYRKEYDAIIIS